MLAITKFYKKERDEMGKKDFTKSAITENLAAMFAAEGDHKTEDQGEKKEKTKEQKPTKKKPGAAEQPAEIPKGYVLKEEPKSQRLQLLLKASTFQDLKKLSEKTGESVNAICNRFFEKCLAEEERKGTK